MTIRGRINHALTKSTGYQIVRAEPPPAEPKAPGKKAPKKAPVARTMPTQRAKVPTDYDEETTEIWDAVRLRTMTRHERVESLITAVRYVERYQVPGRHRGVRGLARRVDARVRPHPPAQGRD